MEPSKRALTLARVADLSASLAFYVERLGMRLVEHDRGAGIAVVELAGYPVLLAGPGAGDLSSWLDDRAETVEPGGTLYVVVPDLDPWRERLASSGSGEVRSLLTGRGDRTLELSDPDGYVVRFWAPVERDAAEIVALYAQGAAALPAALRGLDPAQLDRTARPGAWSIRQIVHHLADVELIALPEIVFALAEPGRDYQGNRLSLDVWARALDHVRRPVEPSLALFSAIRGYVLALVDQQPHALSRSVQLSDGQERSVGTTLSRLAGHALEHIAEIEAIAGSG